MISDQFVRRIKPEEEESLSDLNPTNENNFNHTQNTSCDVFFFLVKQSSSLFYGYEILQTLGKSTFHS